VRLQREEKRLHLLSLGLSQRWSDQRDAIRANAGAESAGYGGYDKEFEEVIDARLTFIEPQTQPPVHLGGDVEVR